MNSSKKPGPQEFDPRVDELASEFVIRQRMGESVSIDHYVQAYPEYESQIVQVFPALLAVEQAAIAVAEPQMLFPMNGLKSKTVVDNDLREYRTIGSYEILGVIGFGGMGVVYLARQPGLDRDVALKILPIHLANDSVAIERFKQEAKAAARMSHPGIVPVYEVNKATAVNQLGETSTLHFFSMQYIEGWSLDKVLKHWSNSRQSNKQTRDTQLPTESGAAQKDMTVDRNSKTRTTPLLSTQSITSSEFVEHLDATNSGHANRPNSGSIEDVFARQATIVPELSNTNPIDIKQNRWKEIARIGAEASDALSHAHQQETLHRDVKPSNLIVGQEGKIWITDFGLAKITSQESLHTEGIVGTLRYMPPERFSGWSDPRSDVYGLGVTLYELAALEPAFKDSDRTRMMKSILDGEKVALRQLDPRIPVDLETIILKSMHVEPSRRYQTAAALRDDLQRFLDGKPIVARRITRLGRVKNWAGRNPVLAWMATSLATILMLASIGSTIAAFQFNDLAAELGKEKDTANGSLLLAYESEAHSRTTSRRPGQKIDALKAVRQAVELLPKVEHDHDDVLRLRNKAIAALALNDIQFDREFPIAFHEAMPSADFRYFGWNETDSLYHLCDAKTGKELWSYQFQNSSQTLMRIASHFSPDSKVVAAHAFPLYGVKVFDVESGRLLLSLKPQFRATLNAIVFSKTKPRMAVASGADPIAIYDTTDLSKPPVEIKVPFPIVGLFFSRDESKLYGYNHYSPHRGDLLVADLKTLETSTIETGYDAVEWALSTDGKTMVIGEASGKTHVVNWPDMASMKFSLPADGDQMAYARVSNDNAFLLTKPWAGNMRMIELSTGNSIFQDWGTFPVFDEASQQLAINQAKKIRFYNIEKSDPCIKSIQTARDLVLHTGSFSPNGKWFAVMIGTELKILDVKSMQFVANVELQDRESDIQIGPEAEFLDNNRLLVVTEDVSIWTINEHDKEVVVEEQKRLTPANQDFYWATGSQQSDRIAWLDPDRIVKVARLSQIEKTVSIKMRTSPAPPYFKLSPDGKTLSLNDGTTRLFETKTGKLIHDFGRQSAGETRTDSRFSPDGKLMICNTGNMHVLFDLKNYQIKSRFPCNGYMCGADWSSDGELVAMVEDFESIVLRSTLNLEAVCRLRTPIARGIQAIRFSPEGRYLFAQVTNRQIHRFDLKEIRAELQRLHLDW